MKRSASASGRMRGGARRSVSGRGALTMKPRSMSSAATAAAVAAELMERGFIVNAPRPDTLRLAPPLILPDADADRFTAVLRRVLADRLTQAGPA